MDTDKTPSRVVNHPVTEMALLKRNMRGLLDQVRDFQQKVDSLMMENRLLRQAYDMQQVEINSLKEDTMRLRVLLLGSGPTHRG